MSSSSARYGPLAGAKPGVKFPGSSKGPSGTFRPLPDDEGGLNIRCLLGDTDLDCSTSNLKFDSRVGRGSLRTGEGARVLTSSCSSGNISLECRIKSIASRNDALEDRSGLTLCRIRMPRNLSSSASSCAMCSSVCLSSSRRCS